MEMQKRADDLKGATKKQKGEVNTLKAHVLMLGQEKKSQTLNFVNERVKVSTLKGDVAKVEVTMRFEILKEIFVDKLLK